MWCVFGLIFLCLVYGQQDQRAADEIKDLPGVNFTLNFKHFSGFLQASPTHFLHYW
jgi:hypothetical protein